MSEYRWTWATGGGPVDRAELRAALAAYMARFRAYPSILFVHPDHLAGGLQAPIGLLVETDRHMPRAVVAFGLPSEEAAGVEVQS